MESFGYSERWWVATTIPFMLMVPFAIVWLVNAELSSSRSKAVHSIMVVLAISYVFAISTAMEAWVCHDYGQDGTYSLVAYPDITCDDSDQRWQGMMAGSFFLYLFFFFGVNLTFCSWLSTMCVCVNKNDEDEKLRYGFIFLRLKEDFSWWDLANNFRKFLTVITGTAVRPSGLEQTSLMLGLGLCFLALQVGSKPYTRPRSNNLERNLLVIQVLQLILSLICEVTGYDGDVMSGLMLTVLILGMALVALELALIVRDMKHEREEEKEHSHTTNTTHQKHADKSAAAGMVELVLGTE